MREDRASEVPLSEQQPTAEPAAPTLTPDQVSGRTFRRYNAAALVVGVLAIAVGAQWASPAPRAVAAYDPLGFAADPRWDDGRAEVARYAATRTIYGAERDYELVLIAVKEAYDPAQRVKPDAPGAGDLPAIKTVAVHEVPTGRAYAYRQQVICRVARADPRHLLDASASSQEWCGNTFQVLERQGAGFRRSAHSYWDGEGDWTSELRGELWLEDQLPLLLRGLDPEAPPAEVQVLPALLGNKAPRTAPLSAEVEVVERGVERTVGAGTFRCVRWVVRFGGEERSYWIAEDGARPLVAFDDGVTEATLSALERSAYWQDPQ